MEGPNPERGDGRWRGSSWLTRRRITLVGTVVMVIGLLVAVRAVDMQAIVTEITSANPAALGGAVAVYLVSWPLRGRRYADVLSAMSHHGGTVFLTAAVFASQTANLVIPARAGDAVRAYLVNTYQQVPYPSGFASLAVERAFDLVAIAVLAGGALAWLVATSYGGPAGLAGEVGGNTAIRAAIGVGGVALVVTGVIVVAAHSDRRFGRVLRARTPDHPTIRRIVDIGVQFGGNLAVVARNPRALAAIGAGSLLIWACDALTAVLVFVALGTGLDTGTVVVVGTLAVSVGNLAKVVPLSQGGIGLYEAAFTALVVGLTPVSPSTALSAALVDHALKNAITLAGGGVSVAALDVSLSAAARE